MASEGIAFSSMHWDRLPPGYRYKVRIALESAKRLPRCLGCVRSGVTVHAFIPHEAYLLEGNDHPPRGYKLCRMCAGMSTKEAGQRLGLVPWQDKVVEVEDEAEAEVKARKYRGKAK